MESDFPADDPRIKDYDPVPYLLDKAQPTDISLVYKNLPFQKKPNLSSVVCIAGPSGVGKDTLMEPLIRKGLVTLATTATTRKRRKGEDFNAYIWMRGRRKDEDKEGYLNNLVEEYDLIEYDFHNQHLYGIPRENLRKAMEHRVALLRIDLTGVKSITKSLGNEANILIIFIVPDSYRQIWERRGDRKDMKGRLLKDIEYVKDAPDVVHFYLHNTKGKQKQAQRCLEELIRKEIAF